jgi:hypothetical protein
MTSDSSSEPLPRLNFFEIAAETPVVVLDGLVHYLLDKPNAETGYFVFEGDRYSLVRAQSLASLELQYLALFAETIEQYKTRYLSQVVDKRIQTAREMQHQLAKSNVLAFLLTQLVPRLMELDLGKERFDAQRQARKEQALRTLLTAQAGSPPAAGSLLQQNVGENVLILDEWIYPLVKMDDLLDEGIDLIVQTNGITCGLSPLCRSLSGVESAYRTAQLPEFLQRQALAEAPERTRILNEIELHERDMAQYLPGAMGALSETGDGCLYRDKEWGVLKRNGVFYVYIEVPEYAVEDPHGSVYRFDATRVGIALINCDPAQLLLPGRAVVLTPYQHMFVSPATAGSAICMPRGAAYFAALQRLPLDEALCTYLQDAKGTLMPAIPTGPTSRSHPS